MLAVFAGLAVACALSGLPAEGDIAWLDNLDKGRTLAAQEGKLPWGNIFRACKLRCCGMDRNRFQIDSRPTGRPAKDLLEIHRQPIGEIGEGSQGYPSSSSARFTPRPLRMLTSLSALSPA